MGAGNKGRWTLGRNCQRWAEVEERPWSYSMQRAAWLALIGPCCTALRLVSCCCSPAACPPAPVRPASRQQRARCARCAHPQPRHLRLLLEAPLLHKLQPAAPPPLQPRHSAVANGRVEEAVYLGLRWPRGPCRARCRGAGRGGRRRRQLRRRRLDLPPLLIQQQRRRQLLARRRCRARRRRERRHRRQLRGGRRCWLRRWSRRCCCRCSSPRRCWNLRRSHGGES